MFSFKFPYTNFHELNLDWILETTKSNTDRIAANELKIKLIGGDDPLGALHPVGSIYMSADSTSPASLFGGEWEQINGCFLIGTGAPENNNDGNSPGSYNYAAEEKGGEAQHTLTNIEMPTHSHEMIMVNNDTTYKIVYGGNGNITTKAGTINYTSESGMYELTTGNAGSGQAHNNMPPYLAVYMWRRVS